MSKIIKTILIISIIIFNAGFTSTPSAIAQDDNLVVEFEKTPLFEETDFKPGDSVTRWVKVTNNSSESQNIALEAINYPGFPNPDNVPAGDLSRALSIIIREKDGSDLYGGSTGEKTLFDFYRKFGFNSTYEHVLTYNLSGNGGTITYEFIIAFPSKKANEWQTATTTFDILIGFQGKEGGPPPPPPSGGPGLPPGLTILEESVTSTVGTTSVTITWTTSYLSTSQVIYDTTPGKFNLSAGPPNYGYTHSKEGDDSGLEKVTSHSVTIAGLTSGTTYYYRAVSHGSLAISREFSFTTSELTEEKIGETEIEAPISPQPEGTTIEGKEQELVEKPSEEFSGGLGNEPTGEKETGKLPMEGKKAWWEGLIDEGLLAAIGLKPLNSKLILFLILIILIFLLVSKIIIRRKKERKNKV